MESLTETELIRARWRRHLHTEALDTTERDDFARSGLAKRVQDLAFRLLILPYDPDVERFETDDAASHLDAHQSINIGNATIRIGTRVIPTAHATALVTQPGDDMPWERYVAIHRNGAIELGLGDRFRTHTDPDGVVSKLVRLVTDASFTWATLDLARSVHSEPNGQAHLLVVALPDTFEALLCNFGVGYVEPRSHYDQKVRCPNEHLLWHIELDQLPSDPDGTSALALEIASRIANAWGTAQTLYVDRMGDFEGQLSARRAKQ